MSDTFTLSPPMALRNISWGKMLTTALILENMYDVESTNKRVIFFINGLYQNSDDIIDMSG